MINVDLQFPCMDQFSNVLTYADMLIDAAAERVEIVFQVPKTGNLSKVGFHTGTVTTGDTLNISFQLDMGYGHLLAFRYYLYGRD